MLKRLSRLLPAAGLMFALLASSAALAACQSQTVEVILATALSSRLNRSGDKIQAVMNQRLRMPDGMLVPAAARLHGRVQAVKTGTRKRPGRIQIIFDQAHYDGERFAFFAEPDTPLGWLSQEDAGSPVWHLAYDRSTEMLVMRLKKRLGADMAVWNQTLGVNSSRTVDYTTPEFMAYFHRQDVLLGSGDRLRLRVPCP